jgi:hypothetical protein
MNKSRRIGAFVAASAAAMGMSALGMSAPAFAGGHDQGSGHGARPVSSWLRAVHANSSSWVAINWRSSSRVCDVQVRITGGRNVAVGYSGNRGYGSLSRGSRLGSGQSDYSAIRITPDYDRGGIAVVRATIKYIDCDAFGRGIGHAPRQSSYWLTLPVVCNTVDRDRGRAHRGPVFHGGGNGHVGPIGNGHGGHPIGNGHGGPIGHGGSSHGGPIGHGGSSHGGPIGHGGSSHGQSGHSSGGHSSDHDGGGHDGGGNGPHGQGHDWPKKQDGSNKLLDAKALISVNG